MPYDDSMAPEPITTDGRAIRRYRKLAGLSNLALSRAAGISSSYLSHIEAERRGGSPAVLKRIADARDVRIADIVDDHMAAAA